MKKQWWHDKIAYQIYPKSFCDSNGDGIGDLRGILSKLDGLKSLGVDILWLSPVYRSPMADQGYDISDYRAIDPRFGTMEDMRELLAETKRRDMYLLMDLVVNHCSDEHEWFRKACEDPEGRYGKYFYIETLGDPVPAEKRKPGCAYSPDGRELPCNWRSYFGGPVWEKLPGHEDKYYLHVFHRKQPDLNWENPALREEIYDMVNWWLDQGLAGFRIDAIINIKKALPFRNYPADREDGLCSIHAMLREAQGISEFLGELRDRCFAPHRAFTVGEVFNEKDEELADFIGENGFFSTMFDFAETVWGSSPEGWHESLAITPDDYRDCVFAAQRRIGTIGFLSNIIENHDEPRGVSRYLPAGVSCQAGKKALAAAYFLVRGLPWIYQGQEIGMENKEFHTLEEVDDIASLDAYEVCRQAGLSHEEALARMGAFSRDNARTPYQWSGEKNAGFTSGTPWLGVNPNYREINRAAQEEEPDSVLHFYRELIALRKNPEFRDTLVYGELVPYLPERSGLMAYVRRREGQEILVLVNLSKEAREVPLPGTGGQAGFSADDAAAAAPDHGEAEAMEWRTVLNNLCPKEAWSSPRNVPADDTDSPHAAGDSADRVKLAPWQALVLNRNRR